MHKMLKFTNVEIEFDVRFSGGKSFNVVIDDKHEKSVHAGHICRVSIFPKRVVIADDKSGAMNLEIRALRQHKHLPSDQAKELDELLAKKRQAGKVAMDNGQWHHVRVVINDDTMETHVDGKQVARLQSSGIAHPTKTNVGLTVNGATIHFDNLQVRTDHQFQN
jgi:hypothetical protein